MIRKPGDLIQASVTTSFLLFLTTGRFLAPDGSPFGVHGLMPDRIYEGDDALSLTVPCTGTTPTGP